MINGIGLLRQFCDTVWEYNAENDRVYFHHDSIMPDMSGAWHPYDDIYEVYRKKIIYKEDTDLWQHYMAAENFKKFLKSEKEDSSFFVRMDHTNH